jgi:hypothetical protein
MLLHMLLVLLLLAHGAIHLAGFAKAFGLAEIKAIERPIGRLSGIAWLTAGLGFVATAILFDASFARWWIIGGSAVILSQALIFRTWSDARFGTLANLAIAVPIVISLLDLRSTSFRSTYEREVHRGLARTMPMPEIADADLMGLPPPVQTYLRRVGVVGKPHVQNFRARLHGGIRKSRDARFMPVRAEQYNFFDQPSRVFLMDGVTFGLPIQALHIYSERSASMRVRIASLVDVVDARGPEMNQGETVTLFNDMCLFAPATLIDAPIAWQAVDGRTVDATLSNGDLRIRAILSFNDNGDLVNFVSKDRFASADGKTYRNLVWSTPVTEYKEFHGFRLIAKGDGVWEEPEGEFVYLHVEVDDVVYNVGDHATEPGAPHDLEVTRR